MDTSVSPIHKLVIGDTGGTNSLASLAPLLASMGGKSDGGMLGGGGLLPLLIGAFLFGGRGIGGMLGGGAAAGVAGVAALEGITTPKDVSQQLNTFQSWAAANAQTLSTQIGTTSAAITAAVTSLTPQMYQSFANAAAVASEQFETVNGNVSRVDASIRDGFAATQLQFQGTAAAAALDNCKIAAASQLEAAKNTSAMVLAVKDGDCDLSKQIASCCCENRLAIANQNALIERNTAALSNQLNMQTCEIKGAISSDGQATRALITGNAFAELQGQLADSKSAIRDAAMLAAITASHAH
jgi:hypothetical protein